MALSRYIWGVTTISVINKLKKEFEEKGITVYKAAKLTGIKYELLRRVFCGERKLSADEFLLILEKCEIDFKKVKERNDVSLRSSGRVI